MLPEEIQEIIKQLEQLPSVGNRLATKLALYLYENIDYSYNLTSKIEKLNEISNCEKCNNLSKNKVCVTCSDTYRDSTKIMILESYIDLLSIENMRVYNGYYFVLGKLISPIKNVMPNDLPMEKFTNRITELCLLNDLEIISGINFTFEGDSTYIYIQNQLKKKFNNIKYTQFANGVSRGSMIEHIDPDTFKAALLNRNNTL